MNNPTPNLNDTSEANLHAVDYWQVLRNRYGIIILAMLLIFATSAIITYVLPQKFKSTCKVQIHSPQAKLDPLEGVSRQQVFGADLSRNFMETQFELIKSEVTLKRVAEDLDLASLWNMDTDQAVYLLKEQIISTEPILGTDLIKITAEHKNKVESQQIAQATALAYKSQREAKEAQRIDDQLNALNSVLQNQEDKVQKKRNALNLVIQTLGITYIEGTDNQYGLEDKSISERASLELEELKKNKRSLESQINTLAGKSDEELISTAAGLQIVDSRVPHLYEQFTATKRELETQATGGLGAKHPRMVASRKFLDQLKKDLDKAVQDLRATLRSRLELVNADIAEQEVVVAEYKDTAQETALTSQDYSDAKNDYETEKALFETMNLQQASQRIKIKMPNVTMSIVEEAKKPRRPSFPNVKLNLAIGAILGLITGIALAFFLEFIDTSVKSLDDVERYLQVPVLAVIPKDIAVLHKTGGNTPDAEAYRILRTNIEFNRKNADDNCITVVSGGAGEGKSTTLVNLSYVCAQGGYSTLIIDADLRRPRLHTFFDINNSIGLTNYLTTDLTLEDVILQTPVENLYFMPSGVVPTDASGILNSSRMAELITDVKQRFDLVLIDSPPILGVSDAAVISSEADQTMIVIQHRKLPRNMLIRVKQAVENVGGDIIGVVLNNVDVRSDNQYQYYTSYYTYYSPSDDEDLTNPVTRRSSVESVSKESSDQELKVVSNKDEDSLY